MRLSFMFLLILSLLPQYGNAQSRTEQMAAYQGFVEVAIAGHRDRGCKKNLQQWLKDGRVRLAFPSSKHVNLAHPLAVQPVFMRAGIVWELKIDRKLIDEGLMTPDQWEEALFHEYQHLAQYFHLRWPLDKVPARPPYTRAHVETLFESEVAAVLAECRFVEQHKIKPLAESWCIKYTSEQAEDLRIAMVYAFTAQPKFDTHRGSLVAMGNRPPRGIYAPLNFRPPPKKK